MSPKLSIHGRNNLFQVLLSREIETKKIGYYSNNIDFEATSQQIDKLMSMLEDKNQLLLQKQSESQSNFEVNIQLLEKGVKFLSECK